MKLLPLLLLLISVAHAETRAQKLWRVSAAVLIAGNAADMASSYGQMELNPALRGSDGRFSCRGVSLKAGLVGGALLIQRMTLRRSPQSAGRFAVVNFTVGGLLGGVAIRNWSAK